MHKTFTSTKTKLKTEDIKQVEPSKDSIDFILNYSKALEVKKLNATQDQAFIILN